MLTIAEMAADALGKSLAEDYRRLFGASRVDAAERLDGIARIALECIGKSDALYHNLEHTLLVTQVGRDILRGRTLTERIEPEDYSHLVIACLLHDIGYVRGVLKGDGADSFVVGPNGERVTLPRGASDAALAPYHVDRSKLFVAERLGRSPTARQRADRTGDRVHALSRSVPATATRPSIARRGLSRQPTSSGSSAIRCT